MAQAQEWRRAKLSDAQATRNAGPGPQVTLSDAWVAWVKAAESGRLHSRSGGRYKPVTIRDYREAMTRRVLPDFGGNRLADVTPEGLRRLVADLRESGLSASAIRNTINPLRALFRDAPEIIDGWSGSNPAAGVRLPAVRSRRTADRIPSPAHTAALVAAAPARDRTFWATACYAGLRRGELRALRVRDVDLEAGRFRIRRSWDRVEREIEPKSEAGKRDVPILAPLRPHLAAQVRSKQPDALVFATSTGGPFDPGDVSKRAAKAWEAAGVAPYTLHECRHGFAAVCIEAGVNAKRLQTWMGHSSVATTYDIYGHLLDPSEAAAIEAVDGFLVGHAVGQGGAAHSGLERTSQQNGTNSPLGSAADETSD